MLEPKFNLMMGAGAVCETIFPIYTECDESSGIWQITRVWARMICSTLRNSSTWATLKTFIKGAKLIHNHEIL